MDTSTMSFSDEASDSSRTRSTPPEKVAPAPGWHTRFIVPLTKPLEASIDDSSAVGKGKIAPTLQDYAAGYVADMKQAAYAQQTGYGYAAPPGRLELPAVHSSQFDEPEPDGPSAIIIIFIPIMVVILTVLLGVLIFLIALLVMRRQRGIRLTEDGGPLDLSRGDGVIGEGGVEGVEARWLETADPDVREAYRRAKEWQTSYPPSSVPTDITLSQFLSIQEKGVSAWSFEPDYEENLSLYVQSRTEITFLSDGPGMPAREGGGNSVMANLPLPKANEVYYWEVKMYEKPATTEVAIGLATKPYPSFRLPGWNRFSVAYFASDGFKSHNYPFTASSYGPPLAEGDVLGVGYRPRSGTVFFTRNGRKLEDCYTGLNKLNLFPTIGANGPCTVHINLGQAGFVFIEANVKKWGLAPMVGTLAPPPAYGSERGSILLDAGYGTPGSSSGQNLGGIGALLEAARTRAAAASGGSTPIPGSSRPIPATGPSASPPSPRASRRHRHPSGSASIPVVPSPLRAGASNSSRPTRQPTPGGEASGLSYVSPTDTPLVAPRVPTVDTNDLGNDEDETFSPNPPTPNRLDISLQSLRGDQSYFSRRQASESGSSSRSDHSGGSNHSGASGSTVRPAPVQRSPSLGPPQDSPPPPGYAPLDPHVYSQGLPADLPEDLINQAIAAMGDTPEPEERSPPPRGPLGWLLRRS